MGSVAYEFNATLASSSSHINYDFTFYDDQSKMSLDNQEEWLNSTANFKGFIIEIMLSNN